MSIFVYKLLQLHLNNFFILKFWYIYACHLEYACHSNIRHIKMEILVKGTNWATMV